MHEILDLYLSQNFPFLKKISKITIFTILHNYIVIDLIFNQTLKSQNVRMFDCSKNFDFLKEFLFIQTFLNGDLWNHLTRKCLFGLNLYDLINLIVLRSSLTNKSSLFPFLICLNVNYLKFLTFFNTFIMVPS